MFYLFENRPFQVFVMYRQETAAPTPLHASPVLPLPWPASRTQRWQRSNQTAKIRSRERSEPSNRICRPLDWGMRGYSTGNGPDSFLLRYIYCITFTQDKALCPMFLVAWCQSLIKVLSNNLTRFVVWFWPGETVMPWEIHVATDLLNFLFYVFLNTSSNKKGKRNLS